MITPDNSSTTCIFCYPPEDRVFLRDELVLGVWDGFPVSPGHALLIPKRHVETWFDASRSEQAALIEAIDQAKLMIEQRQSPDGYNIGINCGKAAGQTIFHLHVHLIPRFVGDVANPRGGVRHVIPKKADYLAPPFGSPGKSAEK